MPSGVCIRAQRLGQVGAVLALLGCAPFVQAVETVRLTIASSHSTNFIPAGALPRVVVAETNARLEAAGSDVRVRWTEAYGGSLYKYDNTLEAIEVGLADIGWVG